MGVKILVISPYAPYPKVGHAGGKVHYYYWNGLVRDDSFDVKLITRCKPQEKKKVYFDTDIDRKLHLYREEKSVWRTIVELLPDYYEKYFPVEYCQDVLNDIKELKNQNYAPDVICLEWSQMLFLVSKVKKVFPNAKIVCTEHDVSFLGVYRYIIGKQKNVSKLWELFLYQCFKRMELACIEQCDRVITFNNKDKNLLIKRSVGKDKIWPMVPYYDGYTKLDRSETEDFIVFFGEMSREENYESAIWFIKNVFDKVDKKLKLYVIGSNPNEKLFKYQSERVVITGFVEDVSVYFEKCLCMVAPLLYGAGIKIKCIEALSGGIPLLTNKIGIEGIYAKDGRDYIHCEKVEDYVNAIQDILSGKIDINKMSKNSRSFIKKAFNKEKSLEDYKEKILSML